MNTLLTAPQRTDRHSDARSASPPTTTLSLAFDSAELRTRVARTTVLDRVALRVALVLVLWGTRPRGASLNVDEHRALVEREQRELSWQRRHLHLPLT